MTEEAGRWKPFDKIARQLACDAARHFVGRWVPGPFDAESVLRYEETVREQEERVAQLEALLHTWVDTCPLACGQSEDILARTRQVLGDDR